LRGFRTKVSMTGQVRGTVENASHAGVRFR
jgi:hypothetical protein